MIRQLKIKDSIIMYEFLYRINDKFEDFYITKDKKRTFFKSIKDIEKLLKYHEVYTIDEKDFHAILIVVREKGFRTYIKILAENNGYLEDILNFINWNFNENLYLKIKKLNPLAKIIPGFYWDFCGSRGQEILFIHRKREPKHDRNYSKT